MRSFWIPISRCIFCALFTGTLSFASTATAEDVSPQIAAAPKKTKPKAKSSSNVYVPTSSTPSSSSLIRPSIGVGAALGYQYIGLGMGVETWVVWPQDFQLGLSYTKASGELTSKSDSNIGLQETLDIEMSILTPTVRYFTSESFYLSLGYALAKTTGKFGYKTIDGSTQNTFVSYKSDMNLLQIGFGSSWQLMSGSVLVIDWLGYGHLLGQKTSIGEDKPASDGSTVEQNVQFFEGISTQEHVKKQLKDQARFYALMMRFGIQF